MSHTEQVCSKLVSLVGSRVFPAIPERVDDTPSVRRWLGSHWPVRLLTVGVARELERTHRSVGFLAMQFFRERLSDVEILVGRLHAPENPEDSGFRFTLDVKWRVKGKSCESSRWSFEIYAEDESPSSAVIYGSGDDAVFVVNV